MVWSFFALDDFNLQFFARKLEALGFSCTLRQFPSARSVKGYINRLFVLRSEELVNLITKGLQAITEDNVYIDGKIQLLSTFTRAYPKGISPNFLSTKSRSFFEFMGNRLNDPVACVVGQ